ncbi:hypothetical protein F0562_000206 [Nyssa sinensis]|uniref:PORR domain-containing protein n=1 Tax=Nyssa sinensis TaxID=561372 RepID=A0A5J5C3L8_9ASTE|nr:hypothetical protein F0562_000206 [Nyssa sinensis]
MQELVFVERLAKLLMMSLNHRLNVVKFNELKRNFGFPDDYLIRIVPKYPEMFRIVNHSGRRSAMEIELMSWKPDLAVSAIEMKARKQDCEPCFSCSLPSTWLKSWERFHAFNSTPYISPYLDPKDLVEGSMEIEKRTISLIYTVLLREGYNGSELIDKDPLVVVKDKFGELMQEGLHEYNQRHYLMNLEKKNKGTILVRPEKRKNRSTEMSEHDDQGGDLGGIFDPEERKRFYKVLFDDGAP